MSWRGIVVALDAGEAFRSRISMYLHPLAGRPVLWHVLSALLEVPAAPEEICVLHRADAPVVLPDLSERVRFVPVERGGEMRALRSAVGETGVALIVDGSAALLTAPSLARLLNAAEGGCATIAVREEQLPGLATAGAASLLSAADDPRDPPESARFACGTPDELLRVTDRHALACAAAVIRDRLVRHHEARGVTFLLPETAWLDIDVRIGGDTLVYPGVVLEGQTVIGSECVIGPYSRVVESTIGRGVELAGWNYVVRTRIRNQAVIEAYARRGQD